MNLAKVSGKLKEQIKIFSGKVSEWLPKVARRFVGEMLYGIASEQSVHLSKIARSLSEKIPLIKTINRLSFELSRKELWERVTSGVLKLAKGDIAADTLLILDLSDIAKAYAKRMEYLGRVYDSSHDKLADGYWTVNIIAAEVGRAEVIPLYSRLYSIEAPDCAGENEEIFRAIDMVSKAFNNHGIWVMDRGMDRKLVFDRLLSSQRRFIIRLKGDRLMRFSGEKTVVSDLAQSDLPPF